MENGVLVDLRGRASLLCKATLSTLLILVTTVSCSTPTADMAKPGGGIVERQQPRTSSSPKLATVPTPKATSVSRPASKKANTPPEPETQRDQQLFQEFQEFLE